MACSASASVRAGSPTWSRSMAAGDGCSSFAGQVDGSQMPGPDERLRAVREHLLDGHDERGARRLADGGQRVEQPRVGADAGPAVDAQRLPAPGQQREHAEVPGLHDVAHRVDAAVAGGVGDGERPVVEHGHEPARAAARRHVGPSVRVGAGEHDEPAHRQVGLAVLVEVVDLLVLDEPARLLVDRLQRRLVADRTLEPVHAATLRVRRPPVRRSAGASATRGRRPRAARGRTAAGRRP